MARRGQPAKAQAMQLSPKKQQYDVMIVGAGLNGLALAYGLAQQGFQILLWERKLPSFKQDARQFVLNYDTCLWLKQIGLGDCVQDALKLQTVGLSMRHRLFPLQLDAAKVRQPFLGGIVAATTLYQLLWDRVAEHASVSLCQLPFTEWDTDDHGVGVQVDGVRYRASLLVAADGSDSSLRQRCGITTESLQPTTTILFSGTKQWPAASDAHLRLDAHCVFAQLPGLTKAADRWIITTGSQRISELSQCIEDKKGQWLEAAFSSRFGQISQLKQLAQVEVTAQRSSSLIADRVVFLGNAAITLPPVAAQGLNLGWRDTACLLAMMSAAKQRGVDYGSKSTLCEYQSLRTRDYDLLWSFAKAVVAYMQQGLDCRQRLLSHTGLLLAIMPGVQRLLVGGLSHRL